MTARKRKQEEDVEVPEGAPRTETPETPLDPPAAREEPAEEPVKAVEEKEEITAAPVEYETTVAEDVPHVVAEFPRAYGAHAPVRTPREPNRGW